MKYASILIVLVFSVFISCKSDKNKDTKVKPPDVLVKKDTTILPIDTNLNSKKQLGDQQFDSLGNFVKRDKALDTVKTFTQTETQTVKDKKKDVPVKKEKTKTVAKANTDNDVIEVDNNKTSKKYYLVGGSFKDFDNAKKFDKKMTKEGYKPKILMPVNDFNRVALKTFTVEKSARAELEKIRKKFPQIHFWLLKM